MRPLARMDRVDIDTMDATTRKDLVHLACVAAWSDMSIASEEREVVLQLAMELALSEDDLHEVRGWLQHPPPEFDPYAIPPEHKSAFMEALVQVVLADGRIDPEESTTLQLLKELIA